MAVDGAANGVAKGPADGAPVPEPTDVWASVVGQAGPISQLRAAAEAPVHAYLLVGRRGSGKRDLARAFAAALLSARRSGPEVERHARLALAEQHPDLVVVERAGAAVRTDEALELIRLAMRTPVEGDRKVIVGTGFESTQEEAAARLLKVVEEPPASTVFVLLSDDVPPELVTIASRCVRIDLDPLPESVVVARLVAEGVEPAVATEAAAAATGDLGRARLLVADPRLSARRDGWRSVPSRLDGTGAAVVAAVNELRAHIDGAQAPLDDRHAAEVAALEERVAALGGRGAGRAALKERHNREVRRHRTDELRFGLATLASRYREEAVAAPAGAGAGSWGDGAARALVDAIGAIQRAAEALVRNPSEALVLQALLLSLPPLGRADART